MTNKTRRARGFSTERLVADYLGRWWPGATVGRGADPRGDIIGLPWDCEVKAVAKFSPLQWIRQSKARTAKSGKFGVVVLRSNGQANKVHEYSALLPLEALVELLLKAGYGNMVDTANRDISPIRCPKCGSWMFETMGCATCKL